MNHYQITRRASIFLGVITAGLGCYGAFEFTRKLEGGDITYLVIASPVIAAGAALIPPMAEACWKAGYRLKAFLWWLVLFPAAATVFFAAAERVHQAKATGEAERGAYRSAVVRAENELAEAKAAAFKATQEADEVRGWNNKTHKTYVGRMATEEVALERRKVAEQALLDAEKKAPAESELKAPPWLLPLALDLIAFMAIWTGFSSPTRQTRVDKLTDDEAAALIEQLLKTEQKRGRAARKSGKN
jgi:hypothetical protein